MKQKVCSSGGERPRGYLPPPPGRKTGRTWPGSKKDPLGQLLEPFANIVSTLLKPLGKLLSQQGGQSRQPRCSWRPKEWCEETPKEWCEPTTKQICNEVGVMCTCHVCHVCHVL